MKLKPTDVLGLEKGDDCFVVFRGNELSTVIDGRGQPIVCAMIKQGTIEAIHDDYLCMRIEDGVVAYAWDSVHVGRTSKVERGPKLV